MCRRRQANAIVNALIPKSAGYGHNIQLDSVSLERFRMVTRTSTNRNDSIGYTWTQMIAPSMLGSEDALNEGIIEQQTNVRGTMDKTMAICFSSLSNYDNLGGRSPLNIQIILPPIGSGQVSHRTVYSIVPRPLCFCRRHASWRRRHENREGQDLVLFGHQNGPRRHG